VRFFAVRVYDGVLTQKVREQFTALTAKALRHYLNDQVNERLKSALNGAPVPVSLAPLSAPVQSQNDQGDEKDKLVVTTEAETEGFNIVRAIVRADVDVKRVIGRDTQSYFGVLLDDNNRKPVCRLHFNRGQKYIGLFNAEKVETRHPIETVDDIFKFADELKKAVRAYE